MVCWLDRVGFGGLLGFGFCGWILGAILRFWVVCVVLCLWCFACRGCLLVGCVTPSMWGDVDSCIGLVVVWVFGFLILVLVVWVGRDCIFSCALGFLGWCFKFGGFVDVVLVGWSWVVALWVLVVCGLDLLVVGFLGSGFGVGADFVGVA